MEKITLESFREKVMENKKPVLLEFHGALCSGCRMLEPMLNEAESRYGNKVFFGYVDADHEPLVNTALQVYNLPALFFFRNGHLIQRENGYVLPEKLEADIQKVLS